MSQEAVDLLKKYLSRLYGAGITAPLETGIDTNNVGEQERVVLDDEGVAHCKRRLSEGYAYKSFETIDRDGQEVLVANIVKIRK